MFQEQFYGVSRKFHENFKGVSEKIEGVSGNLKGVSGKFQGCLKSISRVIEDSIKKNLRCFVRVIQCCSVFESLLLHITHRSYPSRRRVCYRLKGPIKLMEIHGGFAVFTARFLVLLIKLTSWRAFYGNFFKRKIWF